MTTPPEAPKPPFGSGIRISGGMLEVTKGLSTWRTPAIGAVVQAIDATGRRTTLTRMALTGPFALAMKKKTGDVHVVVSNPEGETCTVKVKPRKGPETMVWAAAFNAWSAARAQASEA